MAGQAASKASRPASPAAGEAGSGGRSTMARVMDRLRRASAAPWVAGCRVDVFGAVAVGRGLDRGRRLGGRGLGDRWLGRGGLWSGLAPRSGRARRPRFGRVLGRSGCRGRGRGGLVDSGAGSRGRLLGLSGGGARGRVQPRLGGEHRELETEAEAADPGPVRIDRGETTGRGDEGGRIVASGGRVGEARDELGADGLDGLVEQCAQVPATLLERVEQRDPGRAVASDEVVDERLDDLGVDQAEQVADVGLVDPLGRGREQLVEHRFCVAHPAGGEPGDEVERGRLRLPAVGGEDPGELALDLGDRQPSDVIALETRQDRRREAPRARSRRT